MIAAATAWFESNRSLAVSLVSAGMGVAPMTISPFARWLISTYDWRTAMLAIGILSWALLLPAALLVRRPPASGTAGAASGPVTGGPTMSAAQALRSPQFLVLGLTFFACCAAHSGPIFHMVSYAIFCGVGPMAAVSIYSLEGLAGLGGRLLLGLLGDRYGAKPVLIAGLLVQALAIGAYVFVSRLGEFYALAAIFGTAYGGVMPLYAVLAREYFGQHIMGRLRRRDHAVGRRDGFRPAGGRLGVRRVQQLRLAVHRLLRRRLGAVAIALAFPPLPRERLQPA
jgi:predicted MFS family arabinose efflux permease